MSQPCKRYRTIFTGELVQKTALSIGGRDLNTLVDDNFALDGAERPVLRGTGLAGALIATARDLFGENNLPECITYGAMTQKDFYRDSAWITHNAHLTDQSGNDWHYRTGVGISQTTGAAAEGALFDTETLPAGTRWCFCLEIEHDLDDEKDSALATSCQVLREWQENGCLMGRDVARGMGWLKLESLRVLTLTTEDLTDWPDAAADTKTALEALFTRRTHATKDLAAIINGLGSDAPKPNHATKSLRGTITLCAGESAWGLDSLSIGGHEMNRGLQKLEMRSLKPLGQKNDGYDKRLAQSDLTFCWIRRQGSVEPEPFIPGSGLRGPMRHAFSWIERRSGNPIWDPNNGRNIDPPKARDENIAAWFGTPEESARLLISDALIQGDDWRFVLMEQHAEDEFTQGVFADAKFDRLALIKGAFRAEFIFRYESDSENEAFKNALEQFMKLAGHGLVSVGGNAFRGQGALTWEIEYSSNDQSPGLPSSKGVESGDRVG